MYIVFVSVFSAILAILFFWVSQLLAEKLESLILSFVFLTLIILSGIIADIVGVSVTAATEAPFHAKATKKIAGAQEGVYLIRNADRVANIMNDVVGDIAGTVSGALGIALALQIMAHWRDAGQLFLNLAITAFIAALTVGGKAAGKKIALSHANDVVFWVGRVLAGVSRFTGYKIVKPAKRNGAR